jgi:hypothetical protein
MSRLSFVPRVALACAGVVAATSTPACHRSRSGASQLGHSSQALSAGTCSNEPGPGSADVMGVNLTSGNKQTVVGLLENNTVRSKCLQLADDQRTCVNGQLPEVMDIGGWTLSLDAELQDPGDKTYSLQADNGARTVFTPLKDGGPAYSNSGDGTKVIKEVDTSSGPPFPYKYTIVDLVYDWAPDSCAKMVFKEYDFKYIDTSGQTTTVKRHLLESVKDMSGAKIRFVRDQAGGGRVTRIIGPWGNAASDDPAAWTPMMSLYWNATTFLLEAVAPGAENATSPLAQIYRYEPIPGTTPPRSRLKTFQVPGSASVPTLITTFDYQNNRLWRITAPNGLVTEYAYNDLGDGNATFKSETTGKYAFSVTSYSLTNATFVTSKNTKNDNPITAEFDPRDDPFLKDYALNGTAAQHACWPLGSFESASGSSYRNTRLDYKVGERWARPEHYYTANDTASLTFQYGSTSHAFGTPDERAWDAPSVKDHFGNQFTPTDWDLYGYGNAIAGTMSGGGQQVSITQGYDAANRLRRVEGRGQSMAFGLPAVTDMATPSDVLWNDQVVQRVTPTPGAFPGTVRSLVTGIIDSRTGQPKITGSMSFWETGVAAGSVKQMCQGANCIGYAYDDLGRITQFSSNGEISTVTQFHPDGSPNVTTTTLPGNVIQTVTSDWSFENGGTKVTTTVTKKDPNISDGAERQISKEETQYDQYGEYVEAYLTSADQKRRPLIKIQNN